MKQLEVRSFRLLRYKDKEYELSKFMKSVQEIRQGDGGGISSWRPEGKELEWLRLD